MLTSVGRGIIVGSPACRRRRRRPSRERGRTTDARGAVPVAGVEKKPAAWPRLDLGADRSYRYGLMGAAG